MQGVPVNNKNRDVSKERESGKQNTSREINYRALFIMGISFLVAGIGQEIIFFAADIQVFLILGILFLVTGLTGTVVSLKNRDKWKQPS